MSTLYELTNDFRQVLDMAEDPDIDPQVIADTLEGIEGEIEDKADGYAMVIRQLEADVLTIRMEEERLARRRRLIDANIDRMKASLQAAMKTTGKTKFKTSLFSFGIQKNPASVVIDDEAKIPLRFLIAQPPKIDKAAIKKDLTGISRPWAHLEQTEILRIR
ncbi:MAG: siphovirus Gp157 family protein [Lachnospiraceae bacterium]|nr:siphovirus Gp157 family protein [Lachnospiraceae bacterium]